MNKRELLESLSKKGFQKNIIEAFRKIKRENFIPLPYKKFAYEDEALPIGEGQTISQPYTIAFMLSLMELKALEGKNAKILEIGSGSGYVLVLLASVLKKAKIFGLEINTLLAKSSSELLSGSKRIKIINKSGKNGYLKEAPFDRILISASAQNPDILEEIAAQLKDSGILVAPARHSIFQIKKSGVHFIKKEFYGFSFVPFG